MNYIDTKYISLIGPRLRNFTKKSDFLWNFSCPYCGDSTKNRKKARGFVYRTKNDLFYKCHNCAFGTTLSKLIEHVDAGLFKEYSLERYKEGQTSNGRGGKGSGQSVPKPDFDFTAPKFKKKVSFAGLKSFAYMNEKHPAKNIFLQRKLPEESWNDIYYCPNFFEFTNRFIPNKFPSLVGDHPRMIIPFRKTNGEIFAYQGRAFGDEPQKYITIILDENHPKIFGLNRVDTSNDILVVEGPLDSLFLDNCIAVAQSDLRVPDYKDKAILVPDNEPRNKEVCKQIKRCIDDGYRVCLWPSSIKEKDVNDMILGGMTFLEITECIHSNTHHGLEALTVFNSWKRT